MRMLLLVVLLAVTAVAGAKDTPKFLVDVPLQWKPPSSFKIDKDKMTVPDAAIEIETFQDVRPNKEAIGENTEEKTPKPVTTGDDAGAFVSDHLRGVLQEAGLKIVDHGGMVRITGKVTRFFVEETSRYNSEVSVLLTVSAHGRLLWSGTVSGDARHFGRSYKLDNYYEGLSDAITSLAGSMLQNGLLVRALRVPPPPPKQPDVPAVPAQPRAPAPRVMVADAQRSSAVRAPSARKALSSTPAEIPARTPAGHVWVPERRIALVIGNSAYGTPAWPDLQGGPQRDAEELATRLKHLHFEVTLVKNANYDELHSRLEQFGAHITPDSLALFYFAGHGAQAPVGVAKSGMDNYLIPVDTTLVREADANFKALSLSHVREVLHRARAGIVIVDACRPNGLQRPGGAKGAPIRGLGATESVPGMLVVYAAPPGEVAGSQPGQTSPYTLALLKELNSPDQSLTALFSAVRKTTAQLSGSRPPELAGTLNDDVWLEPGASRSRLQ